jgi:hemerythrin-like domain-containing protein
MEFFRKLAAEHARIHGVAAALDAFADSVGEGPVDLHEVIRFVTFFRGYSDGLHHAREESVLFRCLAKAGFAPDGGPLAHLRDEHKKEAALLFQLEKAASAPAPWGPAEHTAIARAARAFTSFERRHMTEEGTLLFPVAEKELGPYVDDVREADARFDERRSARWDVPWLEELAAALTAEHPARPR